MHGGSGRSDRHLGFSPFQFQVDNLALRPQAIKLRCVARSLALLDGPSKRFELADTLGDDGLPPLRMHEAEEGCPEAGVQLNLGVLDSPLDSQHC